MCLAARVFFIGSADRDFVRLFIQYITDFRFLRDSSFGGASADLFFDF
ncbi:hypothetical protein HMPREF1322_1037 [Porphyromonas gingivalis W50]|uniref:Uncharacterized protein n=1 Tax=Porphyromonas gingivalis F0570 TaxID=1227271 RepID=A0A0E2LNC4_PORGN|nr:hypothetical protein HMPREF1322_1037 [Porphyromonas gingivalis W50]EOA10295.1 hypothetical protein A343_2028 [Porphyromonas gingivalis JCVI SC001]ERJ64436.1 hypothetical protein HMPREF1555_01836 [Porphyromonas gingivalis F0570]